MPSDRSSRIEANHESVYEAQRSAARRVATFDPGASPLYEKVAFVVGAPRSGTTWLQQLLLVHPLIATGGESHIFCEGLQTVFDNFANADETSHLSTWVAEGELLTAARAFCDQVFGAQLHGSRPGAEVVLEKTPNHRLQASLQARIYPDARYVHIVRDGRDVAASQHSMWRRQGGGAEYTSVRRVAEGWAEAVRDIRTHFADLSYIELRYEDVVRDTPGALAQIFEHLRLPYDDALCREAASFGDAPVNTAPGSVDVGVRKHEGNLPAERSVALEAGDLLVEFGYADAAEVARLQKLRNRETLVTDARDSGLRLLENAGESLAAARLRWRRRRKRNTARPVKAVNDAFADALATGDAVKLASTLATTVKLDGAATAADDAARELVGKLAGTRSVSRRAADGFGQVTLLGEDGARFVVRIEVKDGKAVGVDVR